MYIGNKHTATTTTSRILDFSCSNCGHKEKVLVTGVGQGQGNSAYFLDESGAKDRAAEGANKKALKNVHQTLKMAKCPNCGMRNKKNMQDFWLIQTLKLVGSFLAMLLMGAFIYAVTEDDVVYIIFGICGLIVVPFIYFVDVHWRWKTVDGRVQFLGNLNLDELTTEE